MLLSPAKMEVDRPYRKDARNNTFFAHAEVYVINRKNGALVGVIKPGMCAHALHSSFEGQTVPSLRQCMADADKKTSVFYVLEIVSASKTATQKTDSGSDNAEALVLRLKKARSLFSADKLQEMDLRADDWVIGNQPLYIPIDSLLTSAPIACGQRKEHFGFLAACLTDANSKLRVKGDISADNVVSVSSKDDLFLCEEDARQYTAPFQWPVLQTTELKAMCVTKTKPADAKPLLVKKPAAVVMPAAEEAAPIAVAAAPPLAAVDNTPTADTLKLRWLAAFRGEGMAQTSEREREREKRLRPSEEDAQWLAAFCDQGMAEAAERKKRLGSSEADARLSSEAKEDDDETDDARGACNKKARINLSLDDLLAEDITPQQSPRETVTW